MSQKANPCNEEKIKECKDLGKVCNPKKGNCVGKYYLKQITNNTGKPKTKPTTIGEFLKKIETYKTAKELIEKYETKTSDDNIIKDYITKKTDLSKEGFLYEILWDICIKLGITELADKHTTTHGIGNINNKALFKIETIKDYFDKYIEEGIISGNSGGYSDITFVHNKILHLVSVKYIDTEGKNIKDFDLQNLCTIIADRTDAENKTKHGYDDIKILLFVKDKKKFIELCKKSNQSSNLLINYISANGRNGNYENVYDLNDLELHFTKLKKYIEIYENDSNKENIGRIEWLKTKYLEIEDKKKFFIPRFHQELFIEKINDLINNNVDKILVGAMPRTGKTHIMAGTILRHVKEHIKKELKNGMQPTYNNYVIITPAPNETIAQYEETFKDHIEFDNYKIKAEIINAENDLEDRKKKNKGTSFHYVYLISKQRLENKGGKQEKDDIDGKDIKEENKNIAKYKKYIDKQFGKDSNFKIIFMDEAHFGMTTEIAVDIFKCLDKNKSVKIFVTATYNKPQDTYNIKEQNVIKWDLYDIRFIKDIMKKENGKDVKEFLEYFDNRFGAKIVNLVLKRNDLTLEDIRKISKQYQHFPDPFLLTSVWDKEFLDKQKTLIDGTNYGFNMDKLFTYRKDGSTFENEEQLIKLFEYYLGYPVKNFTDVNLTFAIDEKDKKEKKGKKDEDGYIAIIKEKLTNDINYKFTKKDISNMNIPDYSDIVIDIEDKQYISIWEFKKGENGERNYKDKHFYKTRGILPRIRDVCTNECRTLQHVQNITSQLWFLPTGVPGRLFDYMLFSLLLFLKNNFKYFYDNHVFFICRTSEEILTVEDDKEMVKKSSIYNMVLGGQEDTIYFQIKGKNIKEQIDDINSKINSKNKSIGDGNGNKKRGLIILTGKKLQLGVSLQSVDIVTLFTNSSSFDAIYQMMFRSMTEVDTKEDCNNISYCAQKRYGFMVDLNPQRVFNTIENLKQNTANSSSSSKYEYIPIPDLINIDRDVFKNEYDNNKDKKEQRKAIQNFSEEFLGRLRDCVINNTSYTGDNEINDRIDKIVDYDIRDFVNIETDYRQIFTNNIINPRQKRNKKGNVDAIQSGPSVKKVIKKKDSKGSDGSKGSKGSKGSDGSKDNKDLLTPSVNTETIKQNVKNVIKIIISILSIIIPCFNDDDEECIILRMNVNTDDDGYVLKNMKDTIIGLLNSIEKNERKKIITREIFLKIFKDRINDGINYAATDDELFEFIKTIFNKMKEKQTGGKIKMKKRVIMKHLIIPKKKLGGDINIDDIYQSKKRQIYNIKDPEKLLEQINKILPFTEKAKNERGEVFTPMALVNEMLDKLPEDVWENKNLKWLDPSAGMGNFPVAVYMRLMKRLKVVIPSEEERRKHILEKMLYMVEIDKANVFMINKIFCGRTYKLNIFEGSFIDSKKGEYKDNDIFSTDVSNIKLKNNKVFIKKVNKLVFDIVVGNPPYNQGGISSKGKDNVKIMIPVIDKQQQQTIWPEFIKKSLNILKLSGYLLFINPLSWLKNTHQLHNDMLEKHIIYLDLWDYAYSIQTINAKIPLSIFLLHNIKNSKKNTIVNIYNKDQKYYDKNIKVYLDKTLSLPLGYIDKLLKLRRFVIDNNCNLDFTKAKPNLKDITLIKKRKTEENQLKYMTLDELQLVKAEDKYCIDTYDLTDKKYQLNITKNYLPDYDKKKIILSHKAELEGIFIDNGKLGVCGNDNYYILGNNLKLIEKIFTFNIIKKASIFTKYRQNFLDTDFFNYVPDLRKLGYKDITEQEFNKLIGI
jgi:hypothetical protein